MHVDSRNLDNNSLEVISISLGQVLPVSAWQWNLPTQKGKSSCWKVEALKSEAAMQDLHKIKQTGQRYFPIQEYGFITSAASTNHWSGFCSVFDEIDFEKRDWVPHSGWPITREDLDPFTSVHYYTGSRPYEYNTEFWLKNNAAFKPLPLNENVVWNKIWQFSPPTRFGPEIQRRNPAIQRIFICIPTQM